MATLPSRYVTAVASALAALDAFAVEGMSEMSTPERFANHLAFLCADLTGPELHEHALAVHRAQCRVLELLPASRCASTTPSRTRCARWPTASRRSRTGASTCSSTPCGAATRSPTGSTRCGSRTTGPGYGFADADAHADGTRPDFAAHWAEALVDEYGPLGDPL